jgi:hypothetical protein
MDELTIGERLDRLERQLAGQRDYQAEAAELVRLREQTEQAQARWDAREAWVNRSQLRDVAWVADHRREVMEAVRGGRVLGPGQAPPADGRLVGVDPGAPSPRTYTRSQLRDPGVWAEHSEDILRAGREGRITDDRPAWQVPTPPRPSQPVMERPQTPTPPGPEDDDGPTGARRRPPFGSGRSTP